MRIFALIGFQEKLREIICNICTSPKKKTSKITVNKVILKRMNNKTLMQI